MRTVTITKMPKRTVEITKPKKSLPGGMPGKKKAC